MSDKFDRLVNLLRELFQLDQPDLDFGLYRIMHAKSGEVTQFLEKDLLPQVKKAFEQYQPADKAAIKKKLDQAVAAAESLGVDPDTNEKVLQLRVELAEGADLEALQNEVYDHLYSFFRRYYSEGDFLAKRVYKPGVYAVPYEGEEVVLHWANKDQYYIKTSEYLRDYAFRLKPDAGDAGGDPMRVHFRLVTAAEGEHGVNKAAEGKDRVFVLAPTGESGHDFLSVETIDGREELVISCEYRPSTMDDWTDETKAQATAAARKNPPKQKDLIDITVMAVLDVTGEAFDGWISELEKPHTKVNGETADYSRLQGHLNRYCARHTFDYFIHKNLGGFLRRELDFYIKNEVMHLDDVQNEDAPKVEQYLSKIKVIRTTAGRVIDFLHQLEEFQRVLWIKQRFVTRVDYCVTLDRISPDLYDLIAQSDTQRAAWVATYRINSLEPKLGEPGYTEPMSAEFLKAHQYLAVDTSLLPLPLKERILEGLEDLDAQLDGVLVHADNFHALRHLAPRFRQQVKLIYIDPPYNTGKDEFVYKDNYRSSSWLSAIEDRASLARELLSRDGLFLSSIADHELDRMRLCLHGVFGRQNFLANFVWNNEGNIDNQSRVKVNHEYIVAYCKDEVLYRHAEVIAPDIGEDSKLYNDTIENSVTKNGPGNPPSEIPLPAGFPASFEQGELPAQEQDWPHLRDPVRVKDGILAAEARAYSGWSSRNLIDAFIENGCEPIQDAKGLTTWFKMTHTGAIYCYKTRERQSHVLSIIRNVGTVKKTSGMLAHMGYAFSYPKPVGLLEYFLRFVNDDDAVVLDYYAGSGTTAHAALNLRRQGGPRRRFIVVDNGSHLEQIIRPRILQTAYCDEWRDENPERHDSGLSLCIKVVALETYEDSIASLDIRRKDAVQATLAEQGARMREDYLLRYSIHAEAAGSSSLLSIDGFIDPQNYKLRTRAVGTDECREQNVDLAETFNSLLGLSVNAMGACRSFAAKFARDSEGRLGVKGRIKENPDGPWWFRTVTGTTPDGKRALIIWRKRPGGDEPEGIEKDNAVLDAWFRTQGYSTTDSEFDIVWVNGDNNLANLRQEEASEEGLGEAGWKVRVIEQDFHRLMFDTSDVPGGA